MIPVDVAAPGAAAVGNASVAAAAVGKTDLANRLADLATAETNLFQNPTNATYRSQALADLDAVILLLGTDTYTAGFVPAVQTERTALAQAATGAALQPALTNLGSTLASVAGVLADEANHGFTLSLNNTTAIAQPGVPTDFGLAIQNTGAEATTFDLSVAGLPEGVTGVFMQNGHTVTSVVVEPGQTLSGGTSGVALEIGESGGTLVATGFSVTATPEGAAELAQTVGGTLSLRSTFVAVVEVDPSAPFVAPGTSVNVTAKILNVVNAPEQLLATLTVVDSSNHVVYTSPQPIPVSLGVQTSFEVVDLGSVSTSGLSGDYTLEVSLTDLSSNPVPGGSGSGTLLVGSPLTASITTSPGTLPPGSGQATNTLQIDSSSTLPGILTLDGATATTPSATTVALYSDATHNLAYVAGTNGINIVNVADPNAPANLGTFGANLIVQGGFTAVRTDKIGGANYLIVGSTVSSNANEFTILVYSLTDPLNPALVNGPSGTPINYAFASDMIVGGTTLLVPTSGFFVSGGTITSQFGTVLNIDLSNPAAPALVGVLNNGNPTPPYAGVTSQYDGVIVNSQIELVASTTSTGANEQSGVGRILVVDHSNPANLTLDPEVDLPGTNRALNIALDGNRALVVGSTGGYLSPYTTDTGGFVGNLTLSVLDVTDPAAPVAIGNTLITDGTFPRFSAGETKLSVLALGGNKFAVSEALVDGNPVLLIVDASDPSHIAVTTVPVTALVNEMAVAGNLLYTTDANGLKIYTIGTLVDLPYTASVEVPKNSVVAGSFNIAPTEIISGATFDTLVWNRALAAGEASDTFTWNSTVSNIQPGQTQPVTLGTTIDFTSAGTPGTVTLPPTDVTSQHIIGLTPAAQTEAPGAAAVYDITLTNPTGGQVSYTLSVAGVPANWVDLPSPVIVAAGATTHVSLTLTADANAALGADSFVVTADSAGGISDSATGSLTLSGAPPVADSESHGVVVALAPATATAGIGTSARYVVQLTNTGSTADTFTLSATGLPASIAAAWSETTITIPPGTSNFRDVTLLLAPAAGTAAGAYHFSIVAQSTSRAGLSSSAAGTLTVAAAGVSIVLTPTTGAPGSTFQLKITNTGKSKDTFKLALAGPAALVGTLGAASVTLAAGASKTVNITTAAVNFADAGMLALTAIATSQNNSAVKASATAKLVIPAKQGLSAQLTPATQSLQQPGAATFLVLPDNIGNVEDAYTATIVGTTGPVTAQLIGLDGQPTQTVPVFRLPGLSTGAIELQTAIGAIGQGSVTVRITSLNDASRTTTITAQLSVGAAAVLLLDPTGASSFVNSGNGGLRIVNGNLVIDSKNAKAAVDSGNGIVSAAEIDVAGGLSQSGKAKFVGTIVKGKSPLADPLAGLVAPTPSGPTFKAVKVSGKKSITLSPGTYVGGINVSNYANVTLLPGVYYLQGGGLKVSGNAKLTGVGVTIYNAPKTSQDTISISGNSIVSLSAPTSGAYQGVAIFQARGSKLPITVSSSTLNLVGTLYAAAARLTLSGNQSQQFNTTSAAAGIPSAIVVADLTISGNGLVVVGSVAPAAPAVQPAVVGGPSNSGVPSALLPAAIDDLQELLTLLTSDLVSHGQSLSATIADPPNSSVANVKGSWSDPASVDADLDLLFASLGDFR